MTGNGGKHSIDLYSDNLRMEISISVRLKFCCSCDFQADSMVLKPEKYFLFQHKLICWFLSRVNIEISHERNWGWAEDHCE